MRLTGSELAAITGLTTGAITGVVTRLEQAGYVCREPDQHDRRKQVLHLVPEGMRDLHAVFDPLREDATTLLAGFDTHQLAAIAEFLTRSTDFAYRRAALLRAQLLVAGGRTRPAARTLAPTEEEA